MEILNVLTHLRRMEYPTLINWTSPYPFQKVFGSIFHLDSNFNRTFCWQTVETLIRRVRIVCLFPIKMTLGLYGLKYIAMGMLWNTYDFIRIVSKLNRCFCNGLKI